MATRATPADIRTAADRHLSSAGAFRDGNTQVQNEVDGLLAVNKGDLMDKLNALQDEWSENVLKVIGKVEDMANYLYEVANQIEAQDRENAGGLP
jgi:uncharacterized protein YukE